MGAEKTRLWPFKRRTSVAMAPFILVGLLALVGALREFVGWPSHAAESLVLIGILVFTLLPIALVLIDTMIERGAVLEYAGVKVDFSRVAAAGARGVSVPANIGVRGRPVYDSGTVEILDTLAQAMLGEVVAIDLEDGHAWWETRLLVLLAGAVRLGRPAIVVFTATDRGVAGVYQGWASPHSLLQALLDADPAYRECYEIAAAAARQSAPEDPLQGLPVPRLPWLDSVALSHGFISSFDPSANPLAPEQLLQGLLGERIEQLAGPPRAISIVRLEELFRPFLCTDAIDQSWPPARQVEAFLDSGATWIGVTQSGQYQHLLARLVGLNGLVKSLVQPAQP